MRRLTIWTLAVSVAAVLLAGDVMLRAQEPPPVTKGPYVGGSLPVLTDIQKLQILGAAKDLEIAQLKLDAARQAMQALISAVTPAGYQINAQLGLEPLPVPVKEKP